jgi:hypothetical protein
MPIFDQLPPDLQNSSINSALQAGNVLRLFCSFTKPPKEKRLIIVNPDPLIGFFIINSRLNEFVLHNPDLLQSQVLIHPGDYAFIDRDSYIACDKVIFNFTRANIEKQLREDYARCLGGIDEKLRDIIIRTCQQSVTLTGAEIDQIVTNLSAMSF